MFSKYVKYSFIGNFNKSIVVFSVLLVIISGSVLLSSNAFAFGETIVLPFSETSNVIIDGEINDLEYTGSYVDSNTNIIVNWEHDGENIYVGLISKGTGWISIGFGPENSGMDGANIIIGSVDDVSGSLTISDELGVGFEHFTDSEQGGTNDILNHVGSQSNGQTIIEFIIPLNSGDVFDHAFEIGGIYGFILAYQISDDDIKMYHTDHSISLSLNIQDPDSIPDEGLGEQVEPKSTSLKIDLPNEGALNDKVSFSAKLIDEDGVIVVNSIVDFYVNTTFGEVKVGSALTDEEGIALMSITRKIDGAISVRAEFVGDNGLLQSSDLGNIVVSGAHVEEDNPIWWVFDATKVVIVLVFASVYSVYAFAIYQIRRISKEGDA